MLIRSGIIVSRAYLLSTGKHPSQITFYGLTGSPERWKKIPLDASEPPVTFAAKAHAFAKKTLFIMF